MKQLPIVAAIVSAALPARADGVGVVAGGGTREERAALAAALGEAIGGGGRVVLDAAGEARGQLARGAVPIEVLARFRRVREMVDEGWRAFLRVQIDFAHSRLAAARSEAEALVSLPGGPQLYADAALRLGAVMAHRQVAEAPAVLALAIALDPARPITLAEFSPDVVDAVAAARATPAAIQRVRVTSSPAGARISVDGVEVGAAPLDVQLTRGQHLVIARAPMHHAAVRGVAIDGAATIDLALDRDDAALALADGARLGLAAPAERALIEAALQFAELDDVVVAAVSARRGGPALIAQRCGGAPVRCTAAVEVGYGEGAGLASAAREAWRSVQGGELRYPPGVLGDARPAVAERAGCGWCRSPLVWTGVSAVVLGAVAAIVLSAGDRPPPVVTVDGRDFGR